MDILGKEGEKAQENVRHLADELEKLESHLNAVDAALQDFMGQAESVEESERSILEGELDRIESLLDRTEKVDELEEEFRELKKRQKENSSRLEKLLDSELRGTVNALRDAAEKSREVSREAKSELRKVKKRMDELESKFVLEVNSRDYDFDQKLGKREFERQKEELESQIRSLRASVNVLADELDKKDEIEVD